MKLERRREAQGAEWAEGHTWGLTRPSGQEGPACPSVGVEACGFEGCWCGGGDRLWSLDGGGAGGARGVGSSSGRAVSAVRARLCLPFPGGQDPAPCPVSGSGISVLPASEMVWAALSSVSWGRLTELVSSSFCSLFLAVLGPRCWRGPALKLQGVGF